MKVFQCIYQKLTKYKDSIALLFILFFTTFIFMSRSTLHFWIGGDVEIDSAVFKTIAFMMDKGYMPYRDSFDHKGPLLYLINYFGLRISKYSGVWVIEFFTIFVTFYLIYKIGCLCCSKLYAVMILLMVTVPLFDYFHGGNMSEEYAMPFIAASLFYFLDYMINGKVTTLRLIICGACFGSVCLLRPNMVAVWVVFCLAIFIDLCRQKNFIVLPQFFICFLIGFAIVTLPIVLWLLLKHSFIPFWDQYIVFNRKYCAYATGTEFLNSFFSPLKQWIIIFSLTVTIILYKVQHDFLHGTYIVYIICSLLFISVSGRIESHYNMVLIPAIVFPLASICGLCEKYWKGMAGQIAMTVLSAMLLSVYILPDWISVTCNMFDIYQTRNEDHHTERVRTVCRIIDENTEDDDKISVYGNWNIIYLMSDRIHATHYSYQEPIGNMVPEVKLDYFKELKEEMPKIIVTREGSIDDDLVSFIQSNGYSLLWSEKEVWDSGWQNALIYIYDN